MPASSPPGSSRPGLTGALSNVVSGARQVASDLLELLALEARRAGLTLIWMIALGLATAFLGVTAWLALMVVLALCAVAWGLGWIGAFLGLAALNLIGASVTVCACMKISRNLLFSASRRRISNTLAGRSPAE